jgi:hypothetical protein
LAKKTVAKKAAAKKTAAPVKVTKAFEEVHKLYGSLELDLKKLKKQLDLIEHDPHPGDPGP